MFSIRIYLGAAFAIALLAFGLGQVVPGAGVAFAALASTLWTAYVVACERRLKRTS